ncbi:MAG: gamma-butyrobetaine hydroxylase-like domain-containing protein [Rhodothermaceae bacterium]
MASPKKIKLNEQKTLSIIWDNGKTHIYPLKFLRDESPDAGNKGETVLWQHYEAPEKGPDKPGKYEVEKIQTVGSYAINILWKDGNSDGIYSWEYLLKLGEQIEMEKIIPNKEDIDHEH